MISIKKIYNSIGAEKKKIKYFVFLIFVSALLEIIGVALVVPVITLILSSEDILKLNFSFFNINQIYFKKETLLLITVLTIFVFYLIKSIFLSYFNYWRSNYIFSLNEILSNKLFKIYLHKPFKFHLQRNSSVSTRNLLAVQNYVRNIDQVAHLITEFGILLFFFIILFIFEPLMTLVISLICLIFTFGYNKIISPINYRIGKESHESSQEMLKSINQGLYGIKDIKLYGREHDFFNYFSLKVKKFSKALTMYEFLQPLPRILLEFLAVILIILTVSILFHFSYDDDKIIIFIALLAAIGFKLIPSFNKVIFAIQHLKHYLPLTQTITDELSDDELIKNKIDNKSIIFKKTVNIKNLFYNYEGNKNVLDSLSFEIKKNETIGIIGKTGSGKTTLINILLGLLDIKYGSIKIDGVEQKLNNRHWKNKIGYVPQDIYIIDDTIKRNIAFGISDEKIDIGKINSAIKVAQIDKFINDLPETIETNVGENGSKLSGGQIQRLGIARALYNNPEILIFDEASSSLDSSTEENLINAIKKISQNKTIIMISHKMSALKFCNSIFTLVNGKLIKVNK